MKRILTLLTALLTVTAAGAKIELPDVVGDHMVLQQNADATLWGRAEPGAAVRIATSWGAKTVVRADASGNWRAAVPTPAGSFTPQRIDITSGERITLRDVLIGEVWFASGQSNMDMPLGGYWNGEVTGANEEIACADELRDRVRFVKVGASQSYTQKDRAAGRWQPVTSATAPRCSAAAYFFAKLLSRALSVPVGFIDSSWGGSRIECWMPHAAMEGCADLDLTEEGFAGQELHMRPAAMYNAMVHPLTPYTLRGFIWYQGESNIGHHDVYAERMAAMVASWREAWGGGERMPFYFVEIAPYGYGHHLSALLREAQYKAQAVIPYSGMAPTNDLVAPHEVANIHPANKRDVGHRLAFWALNRTYGRPEVFCEGMQFRSMEVRDGRAFVDFDHTEGGFGRLGDLRGFEICGPDRVFHAAQAAPMSDKQLVVWSDEVAAPVAVRYGFDDFLPGTVINSRGLPLIPFRTDDF